MYGHDRIYGFDIETDNSNGFGLVPAKSSITEIAIDTANGGEVFTGNERTILRDFEEYLGTLESGILVPWNGAFFDVPFITDRWQAVNWMYPNGWNLTLDPQLAPKYNPLDGHDGGYNAYWLNRAGTHHAMLDMAYVYKAYAGDLASERGVPLNKVWSLKPVCTSLGIPMIELDRENLHLYTEQERKEYCLSDARGARLLANMLFGWDQYPDPNQTQTQTAPGLSLVTAGN